MICKSINCKIIIQVFTAIICSMLLISCNGESSSNTTDESSSNTTDEAGVECDSSSQVIIDGRRVCPDQ
jgi:hypothetical protein